MVSEELNTEIKIEALDEIKIKYIGKKGLFTSLIKNLSLLDNNSKALAGKTLTCLNHYL